MQPGNLMAHSTAVVGFWLAHAVARPGMLAEAVTDLFALILAGKLTPVIGGSYRLDQIAEAHRSLRDRSSTGKLILLPND